MTGRSSGCSGVREDLGSPVCVTFRLTSIESEPPRGAETHRALMEIPGFDERLATTLVMRALYWPDAFPTSDRALQEAAGVATPKALRVRAEK